MQTITEVSLERAQGGIFTRNEAACWINSDGASLDALLKRAVADREILRIRRGLFCLANKYLREAIHPFALAQRILGPSYISLESALAHHGWIPEAVYTISSVAEKRSCIFDTPAGHFSFTRIPQTPLFAGVERQEVNSTASFFVASPLKALADYVYVKHCDWTGLAPVRDSLRVDEAELATLKADSFEALLDIYRSGRVRRFLDAARKDLNL